MIKDNGNGLKHNFKIQPDRAGFYVFNIVNNFLFGFQIVAAVNLR